MTCPPFARALLGALALAVSPIPPAAAAPPDRLPRTAHVFYESMVHFLPDSAARYGGGELAHRDNGRVVERTVDLGEPDGPGTILGHLTLHPVPKSESTVFDPWDRAGNIRLVVPGAPDLELVKFITSYGGRTDHTVDLTRLAPLLRGRCTFRGFVDTWLSPGWRIDFSLEFRPADSTAAPAWVRPVVYREILDAAGSDSGGARATVEIPEGTRRVLLRTLVSGHCTDGRDEDEFVTKDNVIRIDGTEVARFRPWRDDCRRFRDLNPYCRRWTDGSWSSDYSRSGWCPGQAVEPREIDLTGWLTPGSHSVEFNVEKIRPRDADGQYGYWRISAALLGWTE